MNNKTILGESKKTDDDQTEFDPDRLLDALLYKLRLRNDRALAFALGVAPPVLSKIRHRKLPVGASLLIRMHETTGLTTAELRALMGDYRKRFNT